uniref:Putative LOC101237537 [Hydra vulgaris] n=1 Tax=Lepeophtheirus salmonis TaxID=72036 RepID=A0A0K2U5D7_LEPSM
MRNLLTKSKES